MHDYKWATSGRQAQKLAASFTLIGYSQRELQAWGMVGTAHQLGQPEISQYLMLIVGIRGS
jgi:hypothetical protein